MAKPRAITEKEYSNFNLSEALTVDYGLTDDQLMDILREIRDMDKNRMRHDVNRHFNRASVSFRYRGHRWMNAPKIGRGVNVMSARIIKCKNQLSRDPLSLIYDMKILILTGISTERSALTSIHR